MLPVRFSVSTLIGDVTLVSVKQNESNNDFELLVRGGCFSWHSRKIGTGNAPNNYFTDTEMLIWPQQYVDSLR